MSYDLERVLESKRALRRDLASRPIEEKLAMLEMLRDRALLIRAARLNEELAEQAGSGGEVDGVEDGSIPGTENGRDLTSSM